LEAELERAAAAPKTVQPGPAQTTP
jgi:hypothetical protein